MWRSNLRGGVVYVKEKCLDYLIFSRARITLRRNALTQAQHNYPQTIRFHCQRFSECFWADGGHDYFTVFELRLTGKGDDFVLWYVKSEAAFLF